MIPANHNIISGNDVHIHPTVRIGKNVTIYDNVTIGPNAVISDNCTIGEPLIDYYQNSNYQQPKTIIGANALIRSFSIIYSGNQIGSNFSTGHHVTIRENNSIGNHVSFGTLSDIQGYSKFGDYVRLHSNVHICQFSSIASFVMIYPYVVFTNDKFPPTTDVCGPSIGNFTQIGVHSVIHSRVNIGENCLIGSQSNVTVDLPDFSFFNGNPGKIADDVRNLKDKNGNNLYPWPMRFKRGMPWSEIGFENWISDNK